jgi:hypothetical protein
MNANDATAATAESGRPGKGNPLANGSFGLNRMWRS